MAHETKQSSAETESIVERGETYRHAEHGPILVTGMWKGTRGEASVDAGPDDQIVAIRYTPDVDCELLEEHVDTLEDFLTAIA